MSEQKKKTDIRKYLDLMVRGLRHLFLHNGILKIIAVIISVILWAGLISQDETITRDKTFQNVSVSVTGTESLKNSGLIVVSDLDEILKDVSIVAAVPQKQYESAEASAYNIRLDLSRIKGTGLQEVKLQSSNTNSFGRVTSINPSSVTVDVEEYMIRPRIPVSARVEGDIPDEWYLAQPIVDPTLVAVSGPAPLVQTISKAEVKIYTSDIEWKEGQDINSYKIKLFNRSGEEVEDPLLNMTTSSLTIDSVTIELNILPREYYLTEDLIKISGEPAPGYRIRNVKCSPDTIMVAARQEVLDQMNELITVNADGLTETTIQQTKVLKPANDAVISNETVTVTLEIEAVEP